MTASTRPERRLKGWHVLTIAVVGFGTVIAANIAMLMAATGSFPGLVVESAYREGRGWDERAAAQAALGWTAQAAYEDGVLSVMIGGRDGPVTDVALSLTVGRPTTDRNDRQVIPTRAGDAYVSALTLEPGQWRVDVETTEGTPYRQTLTVTVPEPG